MKAYKIISHEQEFYENRIVAYENMQELEKYENIENSEVKEICEMSSGCSGADMGYYIIGDDEIIFGDYILEDGSIIGDETHSGEGTNQGSLDIGKTDKMNIENGDCKFLDWSFDLWIGSYWNGSNWKIIVIDTI